MFSIYFGEKNERNYLNKRFSCISFFSYVYVYAEHMRGAFNQTVSNSSDCRSPDLIDLQRTETNQIVTISALISHFLPYFNSSVNPIIYNIMSGESSN